MNIEWTMRKLVLISKLQDRCYGIMVYRCRALDTMGGVANFTTKLNYYGIY